MRFLIFFSIFLHGFYWSWVAGLVVRHLVCSCSEFSEPVLHLVLCSSKTWDGTMASELKEAWPACSEPLLDRLIQRCSFIPQRSENFHSQDCKVRNCLTIPSGWWFTCCARTKSLQGLIGGCSHPPSWVLTESDLVWRVTVEATAVLSLQRVLDSRSVLRSLKGFDTLSLLD